MTRVFRLLKKRFITIPFCPQAKYFHKRFESKERPEICFYEHIILDFVKKVNTVSFVFRDLPCKKSRWRTIGIFVSNDLILTDNQFVHADEVTVAACGTADSDALTKNAFLQREGVGFIARAEDVLAVAVRICGRYRRGNLLPSSANEDLVGIRTE